MLLHKFRYADGVLPNIIAMSYTLSAYAGGILLLAMAAVPGQIAGTLLVAHALILSGYYFHEFAHNSIFKAAEDNSRWGTLMTWINGSCYASFSDLRRKHVRHHVDRADVITFDFKAFLLKSPAWFRRLVLALEWAYIPAVELIMHGYVMLLPFIAKEKEQNRRRVAMVFTVRAAAFATLGWFSPSGLVAYAIAYMIMLHALRFADAYQHTYDAFAVLQGGSIPEDKVRDHAYEQRNTYSNLVSVAHPVWNLLLLNFSYHNAHHERPIEPWHRLPQLHKKLFGDTYPQVLPMSTLLGPHHRYRVKRILSDDYGDVPELPSGRLDPTAFYGAVGVSFLTAV
ncbi:MAG: fatty acid desaturase [Sulfuriferula sp.]|nr:fatty acid desaturase [Sulfuriferula sp.]